MRVFISSLNDSLGNTLIRKLVDAGHQVTTVLAPGAVDEAVRSRNVSYLQGDLSSYNFVHHATEQADAIINLAPFCSTASRTLDPAVLTQTEHLLDAAWAHGNLRFLHCTSLSSRSGSSKPILIDETSTVPNHPQHSTLSTNVALKSESLAWMKYHKRQQNVVLLNLAYIIAPYADWLVNLSPMLTRWPVFVSRGGASIAHVEDVASGLVAALTHGVSGQRYFLTGDNLTHEELAQLTLDIAGRKAPVVTLSRNLIKTLKWVTTQMSCQRPFDLSAPPFTSQYWMADNTYTKSELHLSFRNARQTLEPALKWLKESEVVSDMSLTAL